MLEFTPQAMLELTKALVKIPSVSHTKGENAAADAIRAELAERGVTLRDTSQGTTYTIENK